MYTYVKGGSLTVNKLTPTIKGMSNLVIGNRFIYHAFPVLCEKRLYVSKKDHKF